jgi:hypothetical protein
VTAVTFAVLAAIPFVFRNRFDPVDEPTEPA